MAGILLSAAIFPVHTLAATNAETKKAIEAYYGEQGFMNRIWACELLSRVLNKDKSTGVITGKKNYFAASDILSDNYYKELSSYTASSSKSPDYCVHSRTKEQIFNTFFRDYINLIEQGKMVNGKIVADPEIEQRHDYVFKSCSISIVYFVTISSTKREIPSLFDEAKMVPQVLG